MDLSMNTKQQDFDIKDVFKMQVAMFELHAMSHIFLPSIYNGQFHNCQS